MKKRISPGEALLVLAMAEIIASGEGRWETCETASDCCRTSGVAT